MKVVNELCAIPESEDFKQPVDHKALRLVDYPLIIRQPMDFNTIKKKVKEAKYKSNTCKYYSLLILEFINDINLIFDNCKKYN
jgi:transcription initiation factor TFIID subunit 2